MACRWDGMGFDGALDGWMRTKSRLRRKQTEVIEAIEGYSSYRGDRGYREDSTAGGVVRAGVAYGTPSRDGGLFCDYVGVAKWWWMVDFLEEC